MAYTPVEDGDSFTAASVTSRLTALRDDANDINPKGIEDKALRKEHCLSPILQAGAADISPGAVHSYTFANDQYPGYNIGSPGWKLINTNGDPGGGTPLQADFTAVDLTDTKVIGVLVLFNIQVNTIVDALAVATSREFDALFAIQFQDNAGTWHHLPESETYISSETWVNGGVTTQARMEKDVPIRLLITQTNYKGSIKSVRAMISVNDGTAGWAAHNVRVQLQHGNISAIALRGSLQ